MKYKMSRRQVLQATVFRLFRIKANNRRGGVNENIHFRNVRVGEALENLIEIQADFSEPLKDGPGAAGQEKYIPVIRDISFTDLICGPVGRAFNLPGTQETPISNLVLRRLTIGPAARESILSHLPNPLAEQVSIGGRPFSFGAPQTILVPRSYTDFRPVKKTPNRQGRVGVGQC